MKATKSRSKSKQKSERSLSQKSNLEMDEKIDELISNITLKRPKNAYTQYVLSEIDRTRSQNKNEKIDLVEKVKKCAESWKTLSESSKNKFQKNYDEEKEKYKKDLETVRHYLFRDYNETKKSAPTAYRIFLNEQMRIGFDEGKDPKDIKKSAKKEWSNMSEENKKKYFNLKKQNDDWFSRAKNVNKVTALSVFIQKSIQSAKDNHKEPPKLADVANGWKSLTKNEKKKFKKYADEINEEKQQMKDIFELTHGIKPKRPLGAYKIFLQEKAKNGELKSLKEGKDMWEKLSHEQKDEYLVQAHKLKISYIYKKMIYKKQIKKIMPKKPGSAFAQFLKEKKGQKPANGEKFIVYFRGVYENLSEEQKKKYEEKAEKALEKYRKKMEAFEDKVFDLPKKAHSGFVLYIKDRMPDLKEENKNTPNSELLKIIAKEWKDQKNVDQEKYNKKSEKDSQRFKEQLKEFQQYGYYTKSKGEKIAEGDVDDKGSKKSKKSRKKSVSKSKSSRKSKRSKSKSGIKKEPQEERSRSKSKPKTKTAKSQKSKSKK